jgi:hypothetical protein
MGKSKINVDGRFEGTLEYMPETDNLFTVFGYFDAYDADIVNYQTRDVPTPIEWRPAGDWGPWYKSGAYMSSTKVISGQSQMRITTEWVLDGKIVVTPAPLWRRIVRTLIMNPWWWVQRRTRRDDNDAD